MGLGRAGLDVLVTVLGGTLRRHGHHWLHSAIDWCPPEQGIYMYPMAARLVGPQQQSRDQHEARVLRWRVSIDRLRFDEFVWRPYDDPALHALCSPWFSKEEEWGTWMSVILLACFNLVQFHHVDRVKRQFNGLLPGTPVNLDRHHDWYNGWRRRFDPSHRISIQHTFDTRPAQEYYDWWCGACHPRHLSGEEVLEDRRLAELPADVQPTTSQPWDDLHLSLGVPNQHKRATEVRMDTRRPARRGRDARNHRRCEGVMRERVRPRRAQLDVESHEEQDDLADETAIQLSMVLGHGGC
ncbi:hypothetical protein Ahy_A10g048852 [Arachis hypogaea]|uniref:Aminotransferase-like plant mobile domain-containing protein n=1 Tax=Arachis hypogaea TaxID=3818 RepID=A0A445B620_ARAHY|nr:hypothetical protein Ahy_A10g048852 [Arachis hypogaea]